MSTPNAPSVRDKQMRTVVSRAAITDRRQLAEHALTILDEDMRLRPEPWHKTHDVVRLLRTSISRAEHIAENGPAHALSCLALHDRVLDAVAVHSLECDCGVCEVADGVLDIYAPVPPS